MHWLYTQSLFRYLPPSSSQLFTTHLNIILPLDLGDFPSLPPQHNYMTFHHQAELPSSISLKVETTRDTIT